MEKKYEELLKSVLDNVIEGNRKIRPGTPMAELKDSIEASIASLPPLEFEKFSKAMEDKEAAGELLKKAPEIIGWDADHLVEWVENLSKKL